MLPDKYLGTDLMEYECEINNGSVPFPVKIVATENWVNFQNTFSQYFMNFSGNTFIPKEGDVVFDCGSCIGEVSMIYGAMVGLSGRVYMFDPVPMHIKFCEFQSESNPKMREIFKSAQFALDKESNYVDSSVLDDSDVISPGGLNVDSYSSISIDDYIKINGIKKLDYIKMDIEGCECNALEGSRTTIKEFKPKLVISAYHKEDDFWVIPKLIKSLNPTYKLFFAHHSPVSWESVIYATE
jgi:FkbM family methyltransferase